MTDENEVDHETNHVSTNGDPESDHHQQQPPPPPPVLKMVLETSNNSTIERNVHSVLRKHFLEQRSITWKPIKVELVVNTQLTDDFFAVRKKFEKASDGNRSEFAEHYAFLIENDNQISDICNHGYHCTETSFNVIGHSKSGIYVCKYADVCIRHASVRRTWEGNVTIKMILFKIVEGKQTAALVRKGSKLQPIGPTPHFTSHCSVITPKETDDLEKQFDQSQIFLYELEGREAYKRPHHCLPYAIISLIQDGTQWPTSFDDPDTELDILETDTLRVIAQSDDPQLQNKIKENVELAEAATRALEHIYEEEAPLPPIMLEQSASPNTNSESIPTATTTDEINIPAIHGTETSTSPTASNDNVSTASPPLTGSSANNTEISSDGIAPPPPPPPSSSTVTINPSVKMSTSVAATTPSFPHPTAAAIQAAYRQQTSLLGALPSATALRAGPGAIYATASGLSNGVGGQLLYGGVSLDALRGYSTTAGATASSPFVFATHAGQGMQQSALYAAQIQALAQQQQAAQLAVAAQQQQQQQQQSLMNGIPAGCMLVRTANGGYALLAQPQTASSTAMQSQAQAAFAQPQYISYNAAGQPTATTGRLPTAMVGGQPQQIVYQYAGQPTVQGGQPQYIQVPANYIQQQQQVSTSPVVQGATSAASQTFSNQSPVQYIGAPQSANNSSSSGALSNSSPVVPSSSSAGQSQSTSTLVAPQKQSAASATAAALQQQQQYHYAQYSPQQQVQQPQHTSSNGAHGTNVYYAAIAQAQAQLTAQVQVQQQAAALAQQQHYQQQQQQQLSLMPQMQYATQQGVPQQMYFTTPGGQSYVLAQAAPTAGLTTTTTTGAPAMYSAGPALHNNTAQQQNASQAQQQQQQQQLAYQIAAATGQTNATAYQMLSAASNGNVATQQQAAAGAGVVAQQPAQLVQRPSVISQVRHHPYRN